MTFEVAGEVVEWRGPAPFIFLPLPDDVAEAVRSLAKEFSYGWGCIPVTAQFGKTSIRTALFPRLGTYYLPIKVAVQRAESISLGGYVCATMTLGGSKE